MDNTAVTRWEKGHYRRVESRTPGSGCLTPGCRSGAGLWFIKTVPQCQEAVISITNLRKASNDTLINCVHLANRSRPRNGVMAEQVDVLICGSGSAGLCAAVWLARCGINYKILERRAGPLENGQADGVQCRTVEIFESFGIAEGLLKEAYHVLEVAFWAAEGEGIKRTHYAADTEPGLSHQPHVILNQARINGMLIEEIQRVSGCAAIEYGCDVQSVEVDDNVYEDSTACCVTTKAISNGQQKVFQSKYVLVSWLNNHLLTFLFRC